MASHSCALEIAGGGSAPAFFGNRRELLRRQPHKFPSMRANKPCRRNLCTAVAKMPPPAQASNNLPSLPDPVFSLTRRRRAEHQRITPEMLDELMRESVVEIVRNVRKAPFLMLVFIEEEGGSNAKGRSNPKWCLCASPPRLMLESEAATAECWPGIKKRWEEESCVPDGLILVEELGIEEETEREAAARRNRGEENQRWGVVIEGRGMEFSACYILNTCRVISPMGYCTHYCLVRAQSNGDPIGVQVMNAWLQRERKKAAPQPPETRVSVRQPASKID